MSVRKAALRAAFFFCVITAALLTPFPGLKAAQLRPALYHGAEDLGHPAVFALLAYLVAGVVSAWKGTLAGRNAALLFATLACFGSLSEVLQHFTGRDASISDFIGDLLGAWMGIALFHVRSDQPASSRKRRALLASLLTAAVLAVLPYTWTLAAYAYRHSQAPVIWRANSPLLDHFARRQVGEYPGLELTELPPDWRGFRELLITVRNPSAESAVFFLRANDFWHNQRYDDRYRGEFTIAPGATQIYRVFLQEIVNAPATRQMDLSRMTTLIVFETREHGVHGIDVREIALAN